jgi:hypothetical protein
MFNDEEPHTPLHLLPLTRECILLQPVHSVNCVTPCRYIWASGADGAFTVSEDEGENEDLGRGK